MRSVNHSIAVCHNLALAISGTRTVDEIYETALEALTRGLGVSRAAILVFDAAGVMRFTASRGLSEAYRQAVEGHSPWTPEAADPLPIVVPDVSTDPSLAAFLPTIQAEGIAGMAFVPLVSQGRVIGKFMVYLDEPRALTDEDLQLAAVIAAHVAYAVHTRPAPRARRAAAKRTSAICSTRPRSVRGTGTWSGRRSSGRTISNGCMACRLVPSTGRSPATSVTSIPTIANA